MTHSSPGSSRDRKASVSAPEVPAVTITPGPACPGVPGGRQSQPASQRRNSVTRASRPGSPGFGVYPLRPWWIASAAAARTDSGTGKSGCPMVRLTASGIVAARARILRMPEARMALARAEAVGREEMAPGMALLADLGLRQAQGALAVVVALLVL